MKGVQLSISTYEAPTIITNKIIANLIITITLLAFRDSFVPTYTSQVTKILIIIAGKSIINLTPAIMGAVIHALLNLPVMPLLNA